jgi:hypothetical protein
MQHDCARGAERTHNIAGPPVTLVSWASIRQVSGQRRRRAVIGLGWDFELRVVAAERTLL